MKASINIFEILIAKIFERKKPIIAMTRSAVILRPFSSIISINLAACSLAAMANRLH